MSVEEQSLPLEALSELSIPMIYSITESLVQEHFDDCHSIGIFHSADYTPLIGATALVGPDFCSILLDQHALSEQYFSIAKETL